MNLNGSGHRRQRRIFACSRRLATLATKINSTIKLNLKYINITHTCRDLYQPGDNEPEKQPNLKNNKEASDHFAISYLDSS